MNKCLSSYYSSKEFRKECEEMYLDKRSKYRTTGVLEKDKYYKKPYYESERKKSVDKKNLEKSILLDS